MKLRSASRCQNDPQPTAGTGSGCRGALAAPNDASGPNTAPGAGSDFSGPMLREWAPSLKAARSQAGGYSPAGGLGRTRVPRRLEETDSPSAVDNSALGFVQSGRWGRMDGQTPAREHFWGASVLEVRAGAAPGTRPALLVSRFCRQQIRPRPRWKAKLFGNRISTWHAAPEVFGTPRRPAPRCLAPQHPPPRPTASEGEGQLCPRDRGSAMTVATIPSPSPSCR